MAVQRPFGDLARNIARFGDWEKIKRRKSSNEVPRRAKDAMQVKFSRDTAPTIQVLQSSMCEMTAHGLSPLIRSIHYRCPPLSFHSQRLLGPLAVQCDLVV
jgi:hypothetical protein